MCQLLVEHAAGRISGERRPALFDGSINDLQIPLDDRDRRGVELSPPLAHDSLKHVDLSSVYKVGMGSISVGLARETGGAPGPTRSNVARREARGCTVRSAGDTETRGCCSRTGIRAPIRFRGSGRQRYL